MNRYAKAAAAGAVVAGAFVALDRLFAAPKYRGPKSDHFDGERFHNPYREEHGGVDVLKWMLTRENGFWRKFVEEPYGAPPPERVSDGRLRITFINHASLLIQMDGLNILTDPIWSHRCSPVPFAGPDRHRNPGLRFSDLPPIDAVIISHNHYDHLDVPTLRELERAHAPAVVTPLNNAPLLARYGIGGTRDLDWWQSVQLTDDITVTCVPAQHFSARAMSDRDRCLWGGFVISGPSGNVYFAGDTGWGPHYAAIRERFGEVRAAMLPIGAYLPRWFMKPVHMSPEDAVRAHRALGAKVSIPMHYGTFHLGDDGELEPLDDLRIAMEQHGATNIVVLGHGEGREF